MDPTQSKFEAVKIGISLSQLLITASLGLLTIIGGGVVYLVKVDSYNYCTFKLLGLSLIALLISIYFGYMGISTARNNGFRGWWSISAGSKYFDYQTWFCLIGILLFLLSTLFIVLDKKENNKEDEKKDIPKILNNKNETLELLFRMEAFGTGEYKLADGMKADLIKLISEIKEANAVFIVGSADRRELCGEIKKEIGSNFELSSLRAESVKSFLIIHGLNSNRIITLVRGGCHQIKVEYSEDRKVDIFIIKKNIPTPFSYN